MQNKEYQLGDLERILRLLSNALRRFVDGDDSNSQTLQDQIDSIEINREYVTQAKELLSDLAKVDSATFVRDHSKALKP
jgi:hypothetical protein